MGDKNLEKDDFFREKITAGKSGYIDLKIFLNCNKIKKMGIDVKTIAEACTGSDHVEISKDKKMIRRKDNKELPAKSESLKKRVAKAAEKANGTVDKSLGKKVLDEEEAEVVARDEAGRILFVPEDFDMENTLILHFKTTDIKEKEDENYKVQWKDIEKLVKSDFDKIKVVYSRADKYEGHLAVSTFKSAK